MALRPCLDCGKTTTGNRCATHQARHQALRDAKRGTTTERGLGWNHQQQRAEAIKQAGPITHCPRCQRPITKTNPITGEHGTARAHGGTDITELCCLICNSTAGATIRRRTS